MATKTTTKSSARKSAASARKPAKSVSQKAATSRAKEIKPRSGEKLTPGPAENAASTSVSRPSEPVEKPAVTKKPESLSLIDEVKPKPKSADSQNKNKKAVLPPISRLISKPETVAPPPSVELPPPPSAPVAAEMIEQRAATADSEVAPVAAEPEEAKNVILIKPPIIVRELALQLSLKPHQLIAELMNFNIFANLNQTIEPDIASKIAEGHGFVLEKERREKGAGVHKVEQVVVAPPKPEPAKEEELKPRAPIITFMGHVDHGKTSLMDAIRKTRVAAGEAGGITQHIGAYRVEYKGEPIMFPDTPGHAAFTAMRARGASVTDIVVLVIAADDGLMPQTIEAIDHAKAAPQVKIMVAINKIDLASANIDRAKKQLQERGLTPEDWGGETITVPVSATRGTNIDQLLEMMTLQAEVMELKASPTAKPRGTVIEAQVEAGRGPTATVIVQMGTLRVGDAFICGDYSGKVKSLMDDRGQAVKAAGPSMPVKAAKHEGVQVKLYSIIYELIDQIKEAMAGLLEPEHRESVIGHAEVKQIFQLSRGIVAGCLVTDGRIARTARARVLRRRQPVYDGGLSTLRRFQDDVKEVRVGLECGIKLGDFSEYQVADIIECYLLEAVAQKLYSPG